MQLTISRLKSKLCMKYLMVLTPGINLLQDGYGILKNFYLKNFMDLKMN